MKSLGTFSKWASNDSLPLSSSFVMSESEQTEDEADVSEGEGHSARRQDSSANGFSGTCVTFRPYCVQPQLRPGSDPSTHYPVETECSVSSLGVAIVGSSSVTPGDLVFSQKCADLRRFSQPLLELLKGLKTGRFDKGLTSFQQSVAIDRLQRILGVLQRPDMGEKYLQHLLQIEMMLKIWFPHLAFQSIEKPKQTMTPQLPPHWCQNQLHMPVKKRKLSCFYLDGKSPNKRMHHQHKKLWRCQVSTSHGSVSTPLPGSAAKLETAEIGSATAAEGSCRAECHPFTYNHGSSRGLLYLSSNIKRESQKQHEFCSLSHCSSQATQDNVVSSSDIAAAHD